MLVNDFLKEYPVCPLCSSELYRPNSHWIVCNENEHYELYLDGDDFGSIKYIDFVSDRYDISINLFLNKAHLFVNKYETSRVIDCDNFRDWMLSHDKMMEKVIKICVLL